MYHLVYKITNLVNNKIYIGKHSTKNIDDGYMGGGKYIIRAIKKYGDEKFKREILYDFKTKEEALLMEKKIVDKEFVKRKDTYNIVRGGLGDWKSTKGKVVVRDKNGNTSSISTTNLRYLSGELVSIFKGTIIVKDKNNNISRISVNDPRYLSGELVGITTGIVTVKDKNNNVFKASTTDPRYLSGELIFIWKNKKHSEETKRKIGFKNSKHQSGKGNSNYGKCWIYNLELKKSKSVLKDELNIWINKGWIKGRKMKWV